MTTDYTRKEAEAIRSAYSALAYLADCSSWSNPPRLKEALRYETKQRSSRTVAQALMVRESLTGVMAVRGACSPRKLSELWDYSPGVLTAHLFGAWCGSETNERLRRLTDEFVAKAELAASSHQDAIDRAWEEV